jgi:predicted RNA-binding protein with PIN domain
VNNYFDERIKARIKEALKQTQAQTEDAAAQTATQVGGLLRVGAQKLREAADKAKDAIQRDIDSRP